MGVGVTRNHLQVLTGWNPDSLYGWAKYNRVAEVVDAPCELINLDKSQVGRVLSL